MIIKNTLFALILLVFGCQSENTKWYKGNTHAHTVICGHADSSPEEVVEWYHNQGYNFFDFE